MTLHSLVDWISDTHPRVNVHLRLCLHIPNAKGAAFEVFLLPDVVAARSVKNSSRPAR